MCDSCRIVAYSHNMHVNQFHAGYVQEADEHLKCLLVSHTRHEKQTSLVFGKYLN